MVDKTMLAEVYKQNLENDIIMALAKIKGIEIRKAFDIYYSSKLAGQIAEGKIQVIIPVLYIVFIIQ